MKYRSLAAAGAAAACLLLTASPVLADDDEGRRPKGREGTQEFWDGPCKVKQEWKKDGEYKEVRECKGLRTDGPDGRQAGDAKEEFSDGPCKIKREWKKDGEYKEERECKGRSGNRAHRQPAAYPPWIVVQAEQPVYRPGREPRAVPGAARCNSEQVGQVLGGAVGAILGNQVGDGSGRVIATAGGAVIGVLVGGKIGRSIDHACIAQALEYGAQGQQVSWTSSAGSQYRVVPGGVYRESGRDCRRFEARVMTPDGWQAVPGRACRRADGVWVTG